MRLRLAAPVLLVYWLMMVGGLALYAMIRIDGISLQSLVLGAIGGTLLGNILALRDIRGPIAAIMIFLTACWLNAVLPSDMIDKRLWMAFVPAALCGFWSLGDRASLAAFWFPAVIWMLSVLDRTGAKSALDRSGTILLGILALLFFVFLRVRESRRIKMWQQVSVLPLGEPRPATLLREAPGRQAARIAWAALVGGIGFGLTAWLAPQLWRTETFGADPVPVARMAHGTGRPCCPVVYDGEPTRSRVKEYFDLGRGREQIDIPQIEGIDCQRCDGEGSVGSVAGGDYRYRYIPGGDYVPYHGRYTGDYTGTGTYGRSGGYYTPGSTYSYTPGSSGYTGGYTTGDSYSTGTTTYTPPASTYTPPAPSYTPTPTPTPTPSYVPPTPTPTPTPSYTPPTPTPPPPPPPPTPTPDPTPMPTPPAAAAPNTAGTPPASTPGAMAVQEHTSLGPTLLRWLAILVGAAIILQLVGLMLRPLRRWITLRHLRRPFWTETVDQRVSNAWQLALVGLRDAGWRSNAEEAPRAFAKRVGVDGLEQCATILERARHGLGIDANDLDEMNRSADVAYRSARAQVGGFGRAAAQIRWPLT